MIAHVHEYVFCRRNDGNIVDLLEVRDESTAEELSSWQTDRNKQRKNHHRETTDRAAPFGNVNVYH